VSAVIEVCLVSYGSGDDLGDAIRSVAEHLPAASIAIQENGPDDASLATARAAAERCGLALRSRHDPSNPGFGAACNALARSSTAEWVLFLNPDATIASWPFDEHGPTQPGILGPSAVRGGSIQQHSGVSYRISDELRRSWLRSYGPPPTGAGFVSGAALLVRRADHQRIGGFDEGFFLFYEDIDYCLRANRAGIETHLVDGWAITHHGAHSTSPRFGQSLIWSYESGCRFHGKQQESLALYRAYVMADASLRWTFHALRRDSIRRKGYASLAARAARDLVPRRHRA
jgi:GT2 family glycosyltransferase